MAPLSSIKADFKCIRRDFLFPFKKNAVLIAMSFTYVHKSLFTEPPFHWHLLHSVFHCATSNQPDINYCKMTTPSSEATISAFLSIAWSETNLKGHELTPNLWALEGPNRSFGLRLQETIHQAPPLINAFSELPPPSSETTCGRPTACPQSIPLCFCIYSKWNIQTERRLTSIGLWVHYFEWHFTNGAASWNSNEPMAISIQL